MGLDYQQIGKRIAARRKALGLKQWEVSERAGISNTYMSSIERAISIPSLEVVMRLAIAMDTTPDEFLVGTFRNEEEDDWRNVAELMRGFDHKRLEMARGLLLWLSEQEL